MIKQFYDFLELTLPASIFAILFTVVGWTFTLKSKGLLKTEEEWYGFGAAMTHIIPLMLGYLIIVQAILFIIFCLCVKIYLLFKKEK